MGKRGKGEKGKEDGKIFDGTDSMDGMNAENKRCEEIRGLLADRALGELDARAAAAVDEHLSGCAACRKEAAELGATIELLGRAPEVEPSAEFEARLSERVAVEPTRVKAARVTMAALVVAAAHHIRRLRLEAAVYVLIVLSLGYILWATVVGEPNYRRPPQWEYRGPSGIIVLVPASNPSPDQVLTAIEKQSPIAKMRIDPYEPELPEPEAGVRDPYPPAGEAMEHTPPMVAPRTLEDLARLPEPPAPGLVLPTGEPGGTALARARFTTIKAAEPAVRTAISNGVLWLCKNQSADGSWKAGDSTNGGRSEYSDVEVTAAASLALMESGFTAYGHGEPSRRLRAALTWLYQQGLERTDGRFAPDGPRQLHAQATACVALSEALRLADREPERRRFRPIVQSGVAALSRAQAATGSWGSGDAELTAMALLAMSSARVAGLGVEPATVNSSLAWLDSYKSSFERHEFAFVSPTGEAWKSVSYVTIGKVLSLPESAWWPRNRAVLESAALGNAPVRWDAGDFFRWYAGTMAAYRLDGPSWQTWRSNLLLHLVLTQNGCIATDKTLKENWGSWEPHGLSSGAGRAYATAMAVLSLTASCGHSPIYGGTH